MRTRFAILVLTALFITAAPAFASGVNISFQNPGGQLGTSQTYTGNSVTVTASGYVCDASSAGSASLSNCASSDLFGKNSGGAETGLGLFGEAGGQNEIGWDDSTHDYVLGLDISSLFQAGATSMTLNFGSVQYGENYTIYGFAANPFTGSVTLSSPLITFNQMVNEGELGSSTISLNSNDQFLVITSQSGNVLLESASSGSPTPEPGTLVLLGSGLLVVGFGLRRRFVIPSE
ncbi:MAG: PEP-CTERM sorting domain-containing protein [Candidatus Acidiferrales bacterium]